jgi:prepilin-type processing-associated H-X9-DG protein/prepilin-type N-terminal cleavage/methylation domain-containing protein
MNVRSFRRAFSMTELLVVIAVILILAGMLIVGINQAYTYALQAKCQHRLEQIGYAVRMYSTASHGALPKYWDTYTARHWYDVIGGEYIDDPSILVCPSVGGPPPAISAADIAAVDSRENIEIIMKTLRWFKKEQILVGDDLGYWPGGSPRSVAGLILLAYLGMGCNDTIPSEFADTVRRTIEYISSESAQYKTGVDAGKWKDGKAVYGAGINVKALCEAARMVEDPGLKARALAAAQLGMNWLVSQQSDTVFGAYGYYGPAATTKADTNATSWVYYAMGAAKKRGLSVPSSAVSLGSTALFNLISPTTSSRPNRSGYTYDPINGYAGGAWRTLPNTPVALSAVMAMKDYCDTPPPSGMAAFLFTLQSGSPIIVKAIDGTGVSYPYQGTTFYHNWHTCNALRQLGGTYWDQWYAVYPAHIAKELVPEGDDMGYFPAVLAGGHAQSGGGTTVGKWYSTALGSMMLSFPFDYSWANQDREFTVADCSYGYCNTLGMNAGTPGADTVVVMDYHKSAIDRDEFEPEKNDTDADIPLRHGGRANVLFADGSVRALLLDEFKPGMFTPEIND